jgi:hypothetical protein
MKAKETVKSWIIFKIDDQQVYQIEYQMHTGQDIIDAYKIMIAGEYDVDEEKIKVSFDDEEIKLKPVTVSSGIRKELKEKFKLGYTSN